MNKLIPIVEMSAASAYKFVTTLYLHARSMAMTIKYRKTCMDHIASSMLLYTIYTQGSSVCMYTYVNKVLSSALYSRTIGKPIDNDIKSSKKISNK